MVHQHFMLVEPFTVAQNIILGSEKTGALGTIDTKAVRQEILELSEKYGLLVDPDEKIEDISVGMQQRVEIDHRVHDLDVRLGAGPKDGPQLAQEDFRLAQGEPDAPRPKKWVLLFGDGNAGGGLIPADVQGADGESLSP